MTIRLGQKQNRGVFKVDRCFLLIGQSNAVGIANTVDKESSLLVGGRPHEFMWSATDDRWITADDPMEHLTGEGTQGMGFGRTFIKDVQATVPKLTVGIIPCARSGSAIGGGDWHRGGTLYDETIARAEKAIARSKGLDGFLWCQGESDANASYASSYASNLETMISQMRADLGTNAPFFAATLPDFAVTAYSPHGATINTQLAAVSSNDFYTIDASDLTNFDGSHYDADSYKTLGSRFATAYLAI